MTAKQIRALRSSLGWTQEKFAKRIGVHVITVSRWECSENAPRGMALKALERLAKESSERVGPCLPEHQVASEAPHGA